MRSYGQQLAADLLKFVVCLVLLMLLVMFTVGCEHETPTCVGGVSNIYPPQTPPSPSPDPNLCR